MKRNIQAFTLVELIVVITILAILATIGFVSFSGYLAGTRDTNRIAQLKSMSDALELYRTKKDLPIPDDKVDVQAGTTTIAYQGYIGSNVLETIEYTEKGLDPKDKTYFSYYLTKNKKYFQLLSFLEEPSEDVLASNTNIDTYTNRNNNIFTSSQAADYSERIPHTKGKKLGILTDENNTPIQEVSSIETAGSLDISTNTTDYVAHLSSESTFSGTGLMLATGVISNVVGKGYKSCKKILESKDGLLGADGKYWISPNSDTSFQVYCDMTTDGGGWTYVGTDSINYTNSYKDFSKKIQIINGSITDVKKDIFEDYFEIGSLIDSDKKVVYLDLYTGFIFNQIKGNWTSKDLTTPNIHNDDNIGYSTWGNIAGGTSGYLQYGTLSTVLKDGNDWGSNHNYQNRIWSNIAAVDVGDNSLIRWSSSDQSSNEYVHIHNINLWVK